MKGLTGIIVIVFAAATFICGAVLMPVAELMPATITSGSWAPGLSPVRSYDAMQQVRDLANQVATMLFPKALEQADKNPKDAKADAVQKVIADVELHDSIPGEVRSYIAYAVFMSLALIFAAVALNAVGRWDSEEKTIIPVKK